MFTVFKRNDGFSTKQYFDTFVGSVDREDYGYGIDNALREILSSTKVTLNKGDDLLVIWCSDDGKANGGRIVEYSVEEKTVLEPSWIPKKG